MALKTQDDLDSLVRSATKARAIARKNGDHTSAWTRDFVDEVEAFNMTIPQLKAAVEAFDGKPDMGAVTGALRASGMTLA